jgi:hypothetical protein
MRRTQPAHLVKSVRCACVCVLGVAVALAAAPAAGQQANAVPAALGMGDNYTAVARGYAAALWNPAALGLASGPSASATLVTVGGLAGMGPVTLRDLADYEGETVPLTVRQRWLADIVRDGGQAGGAGFDVTWAAFQVGRLAGQVSTSGRTLNDISPGFAELILMGNADVDGEPRDIGLGGSVIDGNAHSTFSLSWGMPLTGWPATGRVALGMTAKYTIGHVLGVSQESVGQATADPVGMSLSFPLAYTPVQEDDRYWIRSGAGFGIDIAVAYETPRLVVAAVAHNVVNTFSWDPRRLRFRPLELVFSDSTVDSSTDWQPFTEAPDELRALVDESTFRPSLTVGAALRHSPRLLIAADARIGRTTGMSTRPPVHAGTGVEYRPLAWLPLQAGAAFVRLSERREGFQLGGGAGIELGSFTISASAARRATARGRETAFMISLLSHTF